MRDYHEIYEETNNYIEGQRPEYQYKPEYCFVKEYYPNKKPLIYEKSRYVTREIPPENNAQMRTRKEQYYNYYTESNLPYNENNQYFEENNQNNKRYNTPDRISNSYNLKNIKNNLNNIRDLYSNPSNIRVNIRKKVYNGSHTPQPYNSQIPSNNNIYNNNQEQEFIDNYQYHETKNIKNKGIKKYESITHITGYSNLIPLNRMKNLYGNNYNYNNNNMIKQKLNSYSEQIFGIDKLRKERLLQERLRREEEIRLDKIRQERKRQEEELRYEKMRKEELKQERIRLEQENNKKKFNNKDNINRHEFIKKAKITKYNKIPAKTNVNNLSYNRNYSYQNFPTSNKSTNSIINKINEYKYLNIRKKNKYNNPIRTKNSKITTKINNSSYERRNNNSSSNLNKNKLVSLIKVQQKTASLNFPNQHKKVDTYGENFDERKYKREYINVENVDDGKIENHVETGISKDGQYLISVTSERKIFNENSQNEYYENENEYENDQREEGERLYEKKEEINEEEGDVYELPLPEKNVEEIISTVTTKRKNLGDNYKFYESKNLNKPNIFSVTKHRRRTERTTFGKEEHETREVKTYKLRPQLDEYGQIIGTNKIPYDEEGEEEYVEREEELYDEGEGEEQEGDENEDDMEEEAYYQ